MSINLELSEYNQLQFTGNSVYIPNIGNKGIIITNSGTGLLAWDAADPNHAQQSCSVLSGTGLEGTCGCTDANKYSFITGQSLGNPQLFCGLKNYHVERNGNTLIITN